MIRVEVFVQTGFDSKKKPVYTVLQHDFFSLPEAKVFGEQLSSKGFNVLYFDVNFTSIRPPLSDITEL